MSSRIRWYRFLVYPLTGLVVVDLITISIVVAVIFVSTLTRSTLGFGDALVGMPLLAITIGIGMATPLIAFVATTTAVMILRGSWQQVDVRVAWRLIISSLVGIPVGLILLTNVPEAVVKSILGIILILFGFYNLFTPTLPELRNEKFAFVFGFIAGILGGAYNTNGPPVVIYGTLRRWPPLFFRATLQAYFFPAGFMILVGHGLAGLWNRNVLLLYVAVLPAVLLAILICVVINRRIPVERFSRVVHVFLVVIGAVMIISG